MKTKFLVTFLMLFTAQTFSQTAPLMPEGGVGGGGGCPTCQKSYELSLDLAIQLFDFGLPSVQKKVPQITSLSVIYQTALKRFVKPGDPNDLRGRTMYSMMVGTIPTTWVDIEKYELLSSYEKLKLELHELLVLINLEIDGEYSWSKRLATLFPNFDRMKNYSKTYSCNDDSCVIYWPLDKYNTTDSYLSKYSSLSGTCKFFNLGEYLSSDETVIDVPYFQFIRAIRVDENGVIYLNKSIEGVTEVHVIKKIECKKISN